MVDKLEAVEATQADRNALWAGMVDEMKAQPIGYDEEETSPLSDEDWSNYPGDWVAKAALRALAAQRTTPANGEQVERALRAVKEAARYVAVGDGYFDLYGSAAEAVDAAVDRLAATLSTPTEDARSRVKVLEEALERATGVLEWLADNHPGCYGFEGPFPSHTSSISLEAQCARTALGNKETDRHG